MADELKNALDQIKTDVASISGVQRVELGPIIDSMPDTSSSQCVVSVSMISGVAENETYTATTERHNIQLRFHWVLMPDNKETVEQSMASMWDLLMTKFFGDDADRNLTEKATLYLIGSSNGSSEYKAGYLQIGKGTWYRILDVPSELVLNTHSV